MEPKNRDAKEWCKEISQGNIRRLSQAITIIESNLPDDVEFADALIAETVNNRPVKVSRRIGITGSPGVGKSTFIEKFGLELLKENSTVRVAVLAIDPSSPISGGSILGDRTRMEHLSSHERCMIRPSPSGSSLGGLTRTTADSILLLELAGFDDILIETVGVGQSEVALSNVVDLFLYLHLPGSGDDLQAIKRGILELSDLIVIHKADGSMLPLAKLAEAELKSSLSLRLNSSNDQSVVLASSIIETGHKDLHASIEGYFKNLNAIQDKRTRQALQRLDEQLPIILFDIVRKNPKFTEAYNNAKEDVQNHSHDSRIFVKKYFSKFLNT